MPDLSEDTQTEKVKSDFSFRVHHGKTLACGDGHGGTFAKDEIRLSIYPHHYGLLHDTPEAMVLKLTENNQVTEVLVTEFCNFDIPEENLIDCGSNFIGKQIHQF